MSYSNTLLLGNREPSRIYITSPSFGIDLSVPWLSAEFEREAEVMEYAELCGMTRHSAITRQSFRLNIEFSLDDRGALFHIAKPDRRWDRRLFILDEKIPPLPERPIWLPPGCWECVYCSTTQNADLLQCRSCGAPRIGEDADRCWGHPR